MRAMLAFCLAAGGIATCFFLRETDHPIVFRSHLIISPSSCEFGTLQEGESAERVITLKNEGNDDLRISNLSHSCACSSVKLEASTIRPGCSVPLTLRILARVQTSQLNHTVRFTSQRTGQPEIEHIVNVSAEVRRQVELSPSTLDFGEVGLGMSVSRDFIVYYRGQNPQHLPQTDSMPPEYQLSIQKNPSKTEVKVRVTFTPNEVAGSRHRLLPIYTGCPNSPPLDLTLTASVPSQFSVNPSRINCGVVNRKKGFAQKVTFAGTGSMGIEILSFPKHTRVLRISSGGETPVVYEVVVDTRDATESEVVRGVIVFTTPSPKESRIAIPISGLIDCDRTEKTGK